jgi:hypothetical protein
MPTLAKWLNSDLRVTSGLSKGFTVPQVAQKHDWPEPMVWSQALKGKDDQTRFKELNWGIRTWDLWNFEHIAIYNSNNENLTFFYLRPKIRSCLWSK